MTNPLPPDAEFSGWKAIATYLGVSVRKAQSWEKASGMPVHRMPGEKSRVWAYRAELGGWKQQILAKGRPAADAETAEASEKELPRLPSRRWLLGGLAGAAVAVGSGAAWIISRSSSSGPARAEQAGNSLSAWDESGRLIWRHTFSESLRDASRDPSDFPRRSIQVVDFLGIGRKQVLFVASLSEDPDDAGVPHHEELYCFSPEGRVLWRYKPEISVKLGDTLFRGPWNITGALVRPGAPASPVWLTLAHWQWRPGVLLAIDQTGRATVRFVNAGHLNALAFAPAAVHYHVLVGGVNNEYAAAALAVLRAGAGPSCSPQTPGSRFECVCDPKGRPERYFLFPPTELNVADDKPYSAVVAITEISAQIDITTREVVGLRNESLATAIYSLSAAMEIDSVAFSDGFAVQHRRFEETGKLHHTLDQCRVLSGPKQVRQWDEKSGWTTVGVPLKSGVRPDSHPG